ncbi:hypothetical protein DO97_05085 [Neosynechococcus sphagnicola sy1]|uniref:Uncharacterized protein n=1 Tax=Neosynechococcus sphagnicola sy1 TaxID=1497020 RepID=A0A098TKB9_9CYAN|nr:hypothetical protein DO97_05085 [Neosynechococcus sphagnicola sy1]
MKLSIVVSLKALLRGAFLKTGGAYSILIHQTLMHFRFELALDKLRYLQLELSHRCSIIHWSFDLLPERLV